GLSFHRYGRPRAPPSFPTRRSSDLGFEAPNATVRGGSITVTHGSVIAREIGSPSAALTEIIVGPEGSIKAEMIYPNVRCVVGQRSEEHTSELQSRENLVCRLLLEKK